MWLFPPSFTTIDPVFHLGMIGCKYYPLTRSLDDHSRYLILSPLPQITYLASLALSLHVFWWSHLEPFKSKMNDHRNQEAFSLLSLFSSVLCQGLCPSHHPPRQQVTCFNPMTLKQLTTHSDTDGKVEEEVWINYDMNTIGRNLNRKEITQHWDN